MRNEIPIADYNYTLPEEKIAKFPLKKRDSSNLLIFDGRDINSDVFSNLNKYLSNNQLLLFNNTKVLHARLIFKKSTGARVEIFCLKPSNPIEYQLNFQQNSECEWECIIGNSKRWKTNYLDMNVSVNDKKTKLRAKKVRFSGNSWIINFVWDNPSIQFAEIIQYAGNIPIPPYLNRQSRESDKQDYQTIYSKISGSVAAPTAGLHFTPSLIRNLAKNGIPMAELTLHVGAGTFQPVKSQVISSHEMHSERFYLDLGILKKILNYREQIVAVGTTSLRSLESVYWIGNQVCKGNCPTNGYFRIEQWEPYKEPDSVDVNQSLKSIIQYMELHQLNSITADTSIFIIPGYKFRLVNRLITNFHQPQSTLLLLIAAFVGNDWRKIYEYALKNDFRFLSYGDASLIEYTNK